MLLRVAILSLVLAAVPPVTTAAPANTRYEIEVLVFETRAPQLEGSELWTREAKAPIDIANALPIGTTPATSALSTIANRLRNDHSYRLLAHKRWVQNTDAKTTAKPVLIASGDKELEGTVRFYTSRFLHVEIELGFQPVILSGALGVTESRQPMDKPNPGQVYRISDQRRVKSQEIHYFDHPKFGAVVRIAPTSAAAD